MSYRLPGVNAEINPGNSLLYSFLAQTQFITGKKKSRPTKDETCIPRYHLRLPDTQRLDIVETPDHSKCRYVAIRLILRPIVWDSDQPLQGEFSNWYAPVYSNHRLSLAHRARYYSRSQRFTNNKYKCQAYTDAMSTPCNALIKTYYVVNRPAHEGNRRHTLLVVLLTTHYEFIVHTSRRAITQFQMV